MSDKATDSPLRILLTGANGQVGRAVSRECAKASDIRLIPLDRSDLDITERDRIRAMVRHHAPTHIINTAAYTQVDQAESEPERANAINRDGAAWLAEAARVHDIAMLHISTDFVFDGEQSHPYEPSDTANPLNVYGVSKLSGEKAVMEESEGRALILRTAWVYSLDGKNFLTTMLRLMRERSDLNVVDDQVGTPTSTFTLARVLLQAAREGISGIHHWTDAGVASWYDFAQAIADEAWALDLLVEPPDIHPVGAHEFPTAARRPAFSVLSKSSLRGLLGHEGVHWRRELRRTLRDQR